MNLEIKIHIDLKEVISHLVSKHPTKCILTN